MMQHHSLPHPSSLLFIGRKNHWVGSELRCFVSWNSASQSMTPQHTSTAWHRSLLWSQPAVWQEVYWALPLLQKNSVRRIDFANRCKTEMTEMIQNIRIIRLGCQMKLGSEKWSHTTSQYNSNTKQGKVGIFHMPTASSASAVKTINGILES